NKPNRQIGTAYQQYDLLQKFRFRLSNLLELSANFQLSTSSDVPRYGALTERSGGQLRWARWDYGPQTRLMGALRLQDRRPTLLYDLANYLISHQFIEEDRITRRAGDPLEENNLEEVRATNFQTDFTKSWRDWTMRYGFDVRYDAVVSEAFLKNVLIPTDQLLSLSSRYPSGGSSLAGGGLYLEAQYPLSAQWQVRGGVRYSRQQLTATFGSEDPIEWPQAYLDGITNAEGALTSALGIRYQGKQHRWRFLLAQGFRTPNIDDFAKFRERNRRILVPNPDLSPERSLTTEIGYEIGGPTSPFRAQFTVYHTWLREVIVRRDGSLPGGQSFFVSRGDTLLVQTNDNAESARVYGSDLVLSWHPNQHWLLRTEAHTIWGKRKQLAADGELLTLPQDHIPPPY
ncbi:MAG: TonB-dependent receptor, partial [Bacteroidota bacterium]